MLALQYACVPISLASTHHTLQKRANPAAVLEWWAHKGTENAIMGATVLATAAAAATGIYEALHPVDTTKLTAPKKANVGQKPPKPTGSPQTAVYTPQTAAYPPQIAVYTPQTAA